MIGSAAAAIPLALVTTSAFNSGLILEKRALGRMPPIDPGKPARAIAALLSSPAWLGGLALMLSGLACQVIVLTLEPISLVQPVLAAGVAVSLVLSRIVLHERLGRAESACVAVMVVALVVLALSQDAAAGPGARFPGAVRVLALVAPTLAIGLVFAVWPWRARRGRHSRVPARSATATAMLVGTGAGLLYGVGSLATKGLSGVLTRDHTAVSIGIGILSSPYLYLLGVCSAVAMLLYQAALQACRAAILIPVTNVVGSAFFLVAGTWLFREPLPASPVKLALRLAGIAAGGLVLIVMSLRTAERAAQDD
jgi:hypothetical protein